MIDTAPQPTRTRAHHNKWLALIAGYKCLQALLFAALGVGALRLLHQDIGDVIDNVREALHFSPESRVINYLIEKTAFVDDHFLLRLGYGAFIYATISLVEAVGLYLEKTWAEILTLVITGSFLPWEIYELILKVTWLRATLLIVNLLVFLYLAKVISDRNFLHRKTK